MKKGAYKGIRLFCYRCGHDATSREHVPPLCFFPEEKDISGQNKRRELITVPSCDKHNLNKSGDDQYLFSVITPYLNTNEYAKLQFETKVMRSIKRAPWLINKFFNGLSLGNYNKLETGIFIIDKERIMRELELIARGIFFHHFQIIAPENLKIVIYEIKIIGLEKDKIELNMKIRKMKDISNKATIHLPKYGNNQDIFYYQVIQEVIDKCVLKLVFYEGFIVDALFIGTK